MKGNPLAVGLVLILLGAVGAAAQTAEQHLKKCDASYAKDKYAEAVEHCTKAIEAKPDYDEALMARAAAYEKLGNNDAAVADYTELIRLTDGMAMFHFYRAGIYEKMFELQDALADLTRSIKKDPSGRYAARSHYRRGLIHDQLGNGSDAQADYAAAVKLDPKMTAAKEKLKYPFGDLTITEAADKIIPGVQTPAAEPKPTTQPAAVLKPSPAATPKPVVTPPPTPKPSPTPVPQYRPSTTAPPSVVKTSPTATGPAKPAANHVPEIANQDAKPLFDQGLAHLKLKKYDLAMASFRAALEKYPAESSETIALMMAVDKANVYEQIAAVQLATGQTDAALDTLKNSLNDAFTKLSDAYQAWSGKRPKAYSQYADLAKPVIEADAALLGLTHPSAVRLDAIGRRYIDAVQAAKLNEQQLMKSLAIGFIKLGAGEISSMIFQTTANLKLTLAQNCRNIIPNQCGPGSTRDQVSKYANEALADMNQAIEIAPALKDSYVLRAKIHRFMGRNDLAAADETKAASMK